MVPWPAATSLMTDLAVVSRSPGRVGGVLQVAHGRQRGVVKRALVNQFPDGALSAGNLAGDVVNVGNRAADVAAVLLDEIHQRADQIADFVAGKGVAKPFDAVGGVVQLGHDRVEIGLFLGLQQRAVHRRGRVGRAEADGNEILPHQAGEHDDGRAVGFHHGVGVEFHRDLDLAVGERNLLDAADFHAGHLDVVAHLQFLRGVEQGVEVVAAAAAFPCRRGFP